MNPELLNRAPDASVLRLLAAAAKRRNDEANDALDFLFLGDADGRHAAKCVHALAGGEPCSRSYDPLPYPEAEPADARLYEGTGIAALYGLPGGEAHAWQLAGWTLAPRATR
jgi:hypothetical protein